MKLSRENALKKENWPAAYRLPVFDVELMIEKTLKEPVWLHVGAGNIFRAYLAVLQQDLLEAGLTDKGILVTETYDDELIPLCYNPYDDLCLAVTLNADGSTEKRVIASIARAFNPSGQNIYEYMKLPSLQMVTFTITEKGYNLPEDLGSFAKGPDFPSSVFEYITGGLLHRFRAGAAPVALVSLDNCTKNGEQIARAVQTIAEAWYENGHVPRDFTDYIKGGAVSCPWTMIDKITPGPSKDVAELLERDGFKDTRIIETKKHTFAAPFVNAEACQYLIIEDCFPNGRPPLEKAGVLFTDRETVQKAERMKVSTCLNPLHTVLGIAGMLLRYPTIAACTRDTRLAKFIRKVSEESLPVAANPGVLDPEAFLREVLEERFPNPFIPDTPARIAFDTSQKVSVRFGVTLRERLAAGLSLSDLEYIPLFIALWLRYMTGKDDKGEALALSPDPRLNELQAHIPGTISAILSDASLFGVNLYDEKAGLGLKVEKYFNDLNAGPGSINNVLDAWFLK